MIYVFIVFFLFGLSAYGHTATRTAASCSSADINTEIGLASTGDTVIVPAGNCTHSSTASCGGISSVLCIDKGITLRGSGVGVTNLTYNLTGRGVRVTTTDAWAIQGFSFIEGASAPSLLIQIAANAPSWRINDNDFTDITNTTISIEVATYGVIDSNAFLYTGTGGVDTRMYEEDGTDTQGHNSWQTPYAFGGANAVFIENNLFSAGTATNGTSIADTFSGGRSVIRYNRLIDRNVGSHGTDSGGRRAPSGREVYKNYITNTGAMSRAVNNRGGPYVVWGNTVAGTYNDMTHLNIHRCFEDFPGSWESCDGTNWKICSDDFDRACTADIDCAAGTCSYQFCSGNRDILCNSDATCSAASAGTCSAFLDDNSVSPPICRDQPGIRGGGQERFGTYSWSNTYCGSGTSCTPVADAGDIAVPVGNVDCNQQTVLQSGVDYFNDTQLSGYVPYAYPHPLRQADTLRGGTITGGSQ